MTKCIVIIGIIWAVYTAYLYHKVDTYLETITTLQTQKNALNAELVKTSEQIGKFNEQQMEANKQIAELTEKAMEANDNCYNSRIPSSLIDIVRGNRNASNHNGK